MNRRSYLFRAIALGVIMIACINPTFGYYLVGDSVGDFTLTNWNGQPVSLYDYSDRFVFLNFWYTSS